ncbi:MAG: hypothetical protein ACK5PF_03985, partial [bacterium]
RSSRRIVWSRKTAAPGSSSRSTRLTTQILCLRSPCSQCRNCAGVAGAGPGRTAASCRLDVCATADTVVAWVWTGALAKLQANVYTGDHRVGRQSRVTYL